MAKLGDLPREIVLEICDLLWPRNTHIAEVTEPPGSLDEYKEMLSALTRGREDALNLLLAIRQPREVGKEHNGKCWTAGVTERYLDHTVCIDTKIMDLPRLIGLLRWFASNPGRSASVRRLLLRLDVRIADWKNREAGITADDIESVREQAARARMTFDIGQWVERHPVVNNGSDIYVRMFPYLLLAEKEYQIRCLFVVGILIHLMRNVEQIAVIDRLPHLGPIVKWSEAESPLQSLKQIMLQNVNWKSESYSGILFRLGLQAPQICLGQVTVRHNLLLNEFEPAIFENTTHLTLGWMLMGPDGANRIIQACRQLVSFNCSSDQTFIHDPPQTASTPASILSCLASNHAKSLRSLGLDLAKVWECVAEDYERYGFMSPGDIGIPLLSQGGCSLRALNAFAGLEQLWIDGRTLKEAAKADKAATAAIKTLVAVQTPVAEDVQPAAPVDDNRQVFPWIPPTVKRVCIRATSYLPIGDMLRFAKQDEIKEIRIVEEWERYNNGKLNKARDQFADLRERIIATGTRASMGKVSDFTSWGSQLRASGGDTSR